MTTPSTHLFFIVFAYQNNSVITTMFIVTLAICNLIIKKHLIINWENT